MKAEDRCAPSPFYLHPETRFARIAARSGSWILRAATKCRMRSARKQGRPLGLSWSFAVLPIPPLPQNHLGKGTLGPSGLSSLSVDVQGRVCKVQRGWGCPRGPVPVGLIVELEGARVEWGRGGRLRQPELPKNGVILGTQKLPQDRETFTVSHC